MGSTLMKLIIMRHGEAVPDFMNDDARVLTERGQAQAGAQAMRLEQLCPTVDVLAVSPLIRTQQTADIASKLLEVKKRESYEALVHSKTALEAEACISALEGETLLVVSHMPLVASLESYLCTGDASGGDAFNVAEMTLLETDDPYPGNWRCVGRYRAEC